MHKCPICRDDRFLSNYALKGHLGHCLKKRKYLEINMYENEELFSEREQIDGAQLDLNDALPILNDLSKEFLLKQNLQLSKWSLDNILIGHCALLTGERMMSDLRTYLLIAKFVSHCFGISSEDADDLVQIIKLVSHINGKEIPIPAKYSTIKNRLLSTLDYVKIPLYIFELEMPSSLFTDIIIKQMPKAEGIISNILEIAGKQYFIFPNINIKMSKY